MILHEFITDDRFAPSATVQTKAGQGSSLALAIVCVDRKLKQSQKAMYIACTMASAIQFHDYVAQVGRYTGVKSCILPAGAGSFAFV